MTLSTLTVISFIVCILAVIYGLWRENRRLRELNQVEREMAVHVGNIREWLGGQKVRDEIMFKKLYAQARENELNAQTGAPNVDDQKTQTPTP